MKIFFKSFLFLAIAALAFSCSTEEALDPSVDQLELRLDRPFIGDVDQTPSSSYIRADLTPNTSGPQFPCIIGTNYNEFFLSVIRGTLVSGIGNNPELSIGVRLTDSNNGIYTTNITIPQDQISSQITITQPSGLSGLVTVSVTYINAVGGQPNVPQYYPHRATVANLDCPL